MTVGCFVNLNNLKPILSVRFLFVNIRIKSKAKNGRIKVDYGRIMRAIRIEKVSINIALSQKNAAELAFFSLLYYNLFQILEQSTGKPIECRVIPLQGKTKINIALSIKVRPIQILTSIKGREEV